MSGEKGLGLIEVIVGLGLLAVCLLGMNSLVVSLIGGNLSARLTDQATRLAQTKLADLRSLPYDDVPVGSTTDYWWSAAVDRSVAFQRVTTVQAGVLPDLRAVTVDVAWNDRGTHRVTLTSEMTR
jgi:Tfp pilus assembly protein PilV